MKNKSRVLVLGLMMLLMSASPAMAAKKRVWGAVTTRTTTSSGSGFSVGAKLTGWKQYLNVSFRGVANTTGVTYELVYNGNNTQQGVFGSIQPSEGNVTKSLFLGTCSHGACTAHKNVSEVKLTVNYKTSNGQSVTKRYRVKY